MTHKPKLTNSKFCANSSLWLDIHNTIIHCECNNGSIAQELSQEFTKFVINKPTREADITINFYDLNQDPGLAQKKSWLQTSGHKIEQLDLFPQITLILDFTVLSLNIFVSNDWGLDEVMLILVGSLGTMLRFCLSRKSKVASFHAASLAWEDKGLLLVGNSGAGKTSLSYWCVKQGFQYLTDEDSFIEEVDGPNWSILGYQRRIRLDNEAIFRYPELIQDKEAFRPLNILGHQGRLVDLNQILPDSYILSAPLTALVVLRNDESHNRVQVNRLDKSRARLWLLHSLESVMSPHFSEEGSNLNRQGFDLVDTLLDFMQVFELKYSISQHLLEIPQQLKVLLASQ